MTMFCYLHNNKKLVMRRSSYFRNIWGLIYLSTCFDSQLFSVSKCLKCEIIFFRSCANGWSDNDESGKRATTKSINAEIVVLRDAALSLSLLLSFAITATESISFVQILLWRRRCHNERIILWLLLFHLNLTDHHNLYQLFVHKTPSSINYPLKMYWFWECIYSPHWYQTYHINHLLILWHFHSVQNVLYFQH